MAHAISMTKIAEIAEIDAQINARIDAFLASPIVTWFASCLDRSVEDQLTYEELVGGVLIYKVFLQMDIDGQSTDVSPSYDDPVKHLANLETVMRRIRQFYEVHFEEIILELPHIHLIVEQPQSSVKEVELLLALLLGCAVKCRNNEHFVEKIKSLDEEAQLVIASYIKKILHFPDIVLSKEMLLIESIDNEQQLISDHKQKVDKAFKEIRRINNERNELHMQLRLTSMSHKDMQKREEELNEWKAEAIELNDQLDDYKRKNASIESENKRLASEVKSYRDVLEDISDKVQQNEELDQEIGCYKDQLRKMSFFKIRSDELELNNQSLRENRDELADQLKAYQKTTDKKMREMELEISRLQRRCTELAIENEESCHQNSKLCEENADLERRIKLSTSMNITLDESFSAEADESFSSYNNSSLCEQLSQSTQSHVLKLELENRRLETLQENSFLESSHQILDLEKEKKRLEQVIEEQKVKIRQLQETLTLANIDRMQEETAQRFRSDELESRVHILESEKKRNEKIIEELQKNLHEATEDNSDGNVSNASMMMFKNPAKHKVKYDQLYNDYQSVLQERNSLEKKLKEATLKIMQHHEATSPDEYNKLMEDFSHLMSEYRKEKLEAGELTKRHKDYERELHSRNLKIFEYDTENRRLRNRCEILTDLKNRLELDKQAMNVNMTEMLKQNRELVALSLSRQQQFHEEEKKKNEALNNLNRTKTKLEEKVMYHYRNMDNCRESKKRNSAVTAVKSTFEKVRRAGSDLFRMGRSSTGNDTDAGSSKTTNNTTQPSGFVYIPTPRNNRHIDFFKDFNPEDFTFDDTKSLF